MVGGSEGVRVESKSELMRGDEKARERERERERESGRLLVVVEKRNLEKVCAYINS